MKKKVNKYLLGGITPNGVKFPWEYADQQYVQAVTPVEPNTSSSFTPISDTMRNVFSTSQSYHQNPLTRSIGSGGNGFGNFIKGLDNSQLNAGISGIGNLATNAISSANQKYSTVSDARKATAMNTISGAVSGAAAGAMIGGPIGAVVGGAAGLASGLVGGKSKARDASFYEDPTLEYGTGILGSIGRGSARRKYDELKKKAEGNRIAAMTGQEANADWMYDLDSENNVFAANGGDIGDLAWLDDGELFKTPDQQIYSVPEQGKPEDSNLLNIPDGTKVLSDKLKVPGTKETFANMAKRLTSNKSKYNDKYAQGSAEANAINDKQVFDTLFNIQESIKGDKKEYKAGLQEFQNGGEMKYYPQLAKWIVNTNALGNGPFKPNMWFEDFGQEMQFDEDLKNAGLTRDRWYEYVKRVLTDRANGKDVSAAFKTVTAPNDTISANDPLNMTLYRNVSQMPTSSYSRYKKYIPQEEFDQFGGLFNRRTYDGLTTSAQKAFNERLQGTYRTQDETGQWNMPKWQFGDLDFTNRIDNILDFSDFDRILNMPFTGSGRRSASVQSSGYGMAPNYAPNKVSVPTPVKPELKKDVELKSAGISVEPSKQPDYLPFIPMQAPKQKNKFDWEQLATDITSLVPVVDNLSARPETFMPIFNPYEGASLDLLGRRRYDVRPTVDAIRRGVASSNYAASQNNTNTGANLAFRLQNAVKANNAITGAYADAAIQNNKYAADYANALDAFGQQRAKALDESMMRNAQSRAQARNIRRTGLSQLSNYAQNRLLMRNQRLADQAMLDIYRPLLDAGFTPDQYAKLFNQVSRRG